jgi:hypothetical protein
LENGYSVDILNEDMFLERGAQYPVVIVAEQEGLPPRVLEALNAHVENGGRLLLTGANVPAELGALAGVETAEGQQSGFLPADGGAVIAAGNWQHVTLKGAEELKPLLSDQEPELNQTGFAAATRNRVGQGVVVAAYGPLFRQYNRSHYPRLRRFVGDLMAALDAPGLMRVEGPWWIEMSARKKDSRTLIQLVNRSASGYLAPNRHVVEHVPDAGPFTVTVPAAEPPKRVYLAPDEAGIEWRWKDGVVTAKVGGLAIHNVLVID